MTGLLPILLFNLIFEEIKVTIYRYLYSNLVRYYVSSIQDFCESKAGLKFVLGHWLVGDLNKCY